MTGAADIIDHGRRRELLRILAEVGGIANERVLFAAVATRGFDPSRDQVRQDLDHLKEVGCTTEEWLGTLRKVMLTDRGEDAAAGRIQVDGVSGERR